MHVVGGDVDGVLGHAGGAGGSGGELDSGKDGVVHADRGDEGNFVQGAFFLVVASKEGEMENVDEAVLGNGSDPLLPNIEVHGPDTTAVARNLDHELLRTALVHLEVTRGKGPNDVIPVNLQRRASGALGTVRILSNRIDEMRNRCDDG